MTTTEKQTITVSADIHAPVEKVWNYWIQPAHIVKWNHASDDWHSPKAENDVRKGGKFSIRMEAKDGSFGFDFGGIYDEIITYKHISYTMGDNRKVSVDFSEEKGAVRVTETFDAESTHPVDMQRNGWQAILNNFKNYVESSILHFDILINARPEHVYKTMIGETTYKEWTAVFNPTSHYKGSWEKGEKILFIGTDQDGKAGGMVSRIKENIPSKFISIEHLGMVEGDKEITSGKAVEEWAGALENYTFTEENGKTRLEISMDSNEEFKKYFLETWPNALKKLKEVCER